MRHHVQHQFIGAGHSFCAYGVHVEDALVHIVGDNALNGADGFVFNGQHRRQDGGGGSGSHFQRAAGFGAVANHASDVGNHIFHGVGNLIVVAVHQIGQSAGRASGSDHTAA